MQSITRIGRKVCRFTFDQSPEHPSLNIYDGKREKSASDSIIVLLLGLVFDRRRCDAVVYIVCTDSV